jgi:hypothetical protein
MHIEEQKEIWKPVNSKPGLMASSSGRIRLPESAAKMPHGGLRSYKPSPTFGVVQRASKVARHKYMGLYSYRFGNIKIHRMVCEAFHGPAPASNSVVIHKDENALNNRADNLKWGTQKENLNAPGFIAYCMSRVGENSPRTKWAKRMNSSSP